MRSLKQCLLVGLATLLCASLLSAQTGSIKVTVLSKSGAPDPSFEITSPTDIQTMQSMLTGLQPAPAPTWPQFGFRGYALDNTGVPSFPATLRVFQGTIEIYSTSGINFFADSHGLESFVRSRAGSAAAAVAIKLAPQESGSLVTTPRIINDGGGSPVPTPSVSPTPAPGPSPSPVPTASPTPTASPSPVPTASPTPTATPSPSPSPTASPTPLPVSGSEPTYDPASWNKPGVVTTNNCYAYATNQMTGTFPQPGKNSGTEPTPPYTCDNVTTGAVGDGLAKGECDKACPAGSYKVALVIDPSVDNNDFHWYRQDSNGNWSHKPGGTDATNLDNSGKPITDPRNADRGGYTTFCGCFCVDPKKVNVK